MNKIANLSIAFNIPGIVQALVLSNVCSTWTGDHIHDFQGTCKVGILGPTQAGQVNMGLTSAIPSECKV